MKLKVSCLVHGTVNTLTTAFGLKSSFYKMTPHSIKNFSFMQILLKQPLTLQNLKVTIYIYSLVKCA